ncbi:bleomycin resistance protein [Thalassobius sp. S69A]|uniref:bleomycin resistance protein n=1 Tax=unclassified Thalassovita TaxID=2619711 RepID=UPI003C7B98F2
MTGNRVTANLPSSDFTATADFYARLGFDVAFRNAGWMILKRGALELEFFPHPELDKRTSWFSACIRLDGIDSILAEWQTVGLPDGETDIPRLTGAFQLPDAPRMFALVDPDGSLLRVLENED